MAAKIIDKKEKKDKIVLAAIETFVLKGFDKSTINDIANTAGIGKGTIYEYFKSKEEIIDFSFQYFIKVVSIDFEKVLLSTIPAKDKLIQVLHSFTDFVNPVSEPFLRLMFNFWGEAMRAQSAKNKIFKDMKKLYRSYRSIFADIIIEGKEDGSFKKNINPQNFGSIIVGMMDGIMIQWILDKDEADCQELLSTLINVILQGILNQ